MFARALCFSLIVVAMMGAAAVPAAAQRPLPEAWLPQIAVVWPHDGEGNPAPVETATHVNVSIWPRNAVSCTSDQIPFLSVGIGREPIAVSGEVTQQLRTVEGVTFPTVDYNNVRVVPGQPYRFFTVPSPQMPNSNVWVHAQDARTIHPDQEQPRGIVGEDEAMSGLFAPLPRIRGVWPHDEAGNFAPVEEAPLVNVDVMLVDMLERSVDVGYDGGLSLFVARNNAPLEATGIAGVPVAVVLGEDSFFPTWHFNDVPVSPDAQSHFIVISDTGAYSAPWTHAVDARTILPNPTVPPPCIPEDAG